MVIKIYSRICKGNNKGVGFLRIPANLRKGFVINDYYKITILKELNGITFFGRIKNYSGLGIYVPKKIMLENGLLHKMIKFALERVDGFYVSFSSDGKFRIPKSHYREMNFENDEIILVSAQVEGENIEKACRVKKSLYKTDEALLYCMFGPEFSNKKGIINIIKRVERPAHLYGILEVIKDLNFGIYNGKAIVFNGRMVPIKVNPDIELQDISYYLGHFFADGTKRGNSWGICLSTFEQANVFISKHKDIVTDTNLEFSISYSDLKERAGISYVWEKNTGLRIEKERFHRTNAVESKRRNEFGTLVAKEHRKLTQIIYNRLVDSIIDTIKKEGDINLSIDFICGVLEGDGSPSASSRGHIIISTNRTDAITLIEVLSRTGLDFKLCEEKKVDKVYIRIGALGILKNIPMIKDKLFKYYPKRRKKFIQRFLKVGAVRFIKGKQGHASAWVKAYLRDNGILDAKYNLTEYGREVKNCLTDMEKELK